MAGDRREGCWGVPGADDPLGKYRLGMLPLRLLPLESGDWFIELVEASVGLKGDVQQLLC